MGRAIDKNDFQVNYKYDLVIDAGEGEIAKTNISSPAHTLAQAIYIALQTSPGEFALRSSFGASPKIFHGKALSRTLITEIENYIKNSLLRSNVIDNGLNVSVKAVPVTIDSVAVQVAIINPKKQESSLNIRMMYSTKDNTISPFYNGYGN